jgi:phosphoribosylaminoimidazolecarboxamide formyltransferase/IMP cyclohydrolase
MFDNDCIYFDLVVVNLYPFEKISIEKKDELDECIENIDIGGVSLIRASSKNYENIILLTNPNQYSNFIQTYNNDTNLGHSIVIRKQFAIKGFEMTAHYDKLITNYLSDDESSIELKYGMNPHQGNSNVIFNNNSNPFKVLNGKMGFINVLDAIHGWLTVKELDDLLDYPAAISMKHTSLAGLAIGNNISKNTLGFFNIDYSEKEKVSPLAIAFMKSRVGDPLSSFGDFICVSREVDAFTANLIKKEVCDGIAAPSFSKEALEILTSKKNGNFIILKMDLDYYKKMKETGWVELKSLYGITIKQDSNHYTTVLDESISEDKRIDLILANTALKYAQSNNVSIAYDGQIIGMGCGQQNRVACVKIAGEKAYHWVLRQTSIALNYWSNLNGKRQEKINILYDYVNSIISDIEYNKSSEGIDLYFEELKTKNHAVMASDGFFPFPDNIQVANNYFIKYIIQPGGSIADESIEAECAKYDIKMYYTGTRMFYH